MMEKKKKKWLESLGSGGDARRMRVEMRKYLGKRLKGLEEDAMESMEE